MGCRKVVLCDTTPHLTPKLLRVTISQLRAAAGAIASELEVPSAKLEEVLPPLGVQSFPSLLADSGLEYRAPYDVSRLRESGESFDLIYSHAVLEHVPRAKLPSLFQTMHLLLRPGGLMIHFIDHVDHWHHFDSEISPINFLKFPGWWWAVLNSPIAHQNRLRSAQQLALVQQAGFQIAYVDVRANPRAVEDARRLRLDREFRSFTADELAVASTLLVARIVGPSGDE